MFKPPLTFFSILFFSVLWPCVNANTEIVNFDVTSEPGTLIPWTSRWPILSQGANEHEWSLMLETEKNILKSACSPSRDPYSWTAQSCPYETWAILDLDDEQWKKYSKFTLRISWPASSPASFSIELHTAKTLLAWGTEATADDPSMIRTFTANPQTRLKYARISVVDETSMPSALPHDVRFRIILEPLEFGVLPSSVVPIVFAIVLVVCIAAAAVPRLNRYFARLADKVREELARDEKEK